MTDNLQYYEYLLGISRIGSLYRELFLYPRVVSILSSENVLDVGCGLGGFLHFVNSPEACGLDINPLLVNHVLTRGYRCSQVFANGRFPLADNSFSSLFCDQVMEHLSDPSILLIECKRVLKPNSICIFGVPSIKGFKKDPDHKTFYDSRNLSSTLSQYFDIIKFFYSPFPFSFFGRAISSQSLYAVCRS